MGEPKLVSLVVKVKGSEWFECSLCPALIVPGQRLVELTVSGKKRWLHSLCARTVLEEVIKKREARGIASKAEHGLAKGCERSVNR